MTKGATKRIPAALPHIASFECSCGTVHNSQNGQLPVGWTQRASSVWCADCTRAGIASRNVRRTAQTEKVRLRGEVLDILRSGAALMPLGTSGRAEWVRQVNDLLARQERAA